MHAHKSRWHMVLVVRYKVRVGFLFLQSIAKYVFTVHVFVSGKVIVCWDKTVQTSSFWVLEKWQIHLAVCCSASMVVNGSSGQEIDLHVRHSVFISGSKIFYRKGICLRKLSLNVTPFGFLQISAFNCRGFLLFWWPFNIYRLSCNNFWLCPDFISSRWGMEGGSAGIKVTSSTGCK